VTLPTHLSHESQTFCATLLLGWVLSNWGPITQMAQLQLGKQMKCFFMVAAASLLPPIFRNLEWRSESEVKTVFVFTKNSLGCSNDRRWNFVRSSWNFSRRFLSYLSSFWPVGLLIGVLQKSQKFCKVLLTAANFCQREYSLFQRSNGENISDCLEIFTGASWLMLLHSVRCDLRLEL